MAFDFLLNELSLRTPAENVHNARIAMNSLTSTLSALRKATSQLPFLPSLRVDHSFAYAELAPGYNVAQWQDDQAVDSISRGLLKSFAARGPYLKDLPTEVTDEFPIVYHYTFNGDNCLGLGYAHLLRGLAVSIAIEDCWKVASVDVEAHHLTEELEEVFVATVPHASEVAHIATNEAFILARVDEYKTPIVNFEDLWAHRAALYPDLRFTAEVKNQLNDLDISQLPGIMSSLASYNAYSARWAATASAFSHREMLHVTPESATRIKTFGELLTFGWRGKDRLFSLHGRFTPGAGRIHMWPDLGTRELVIGYVGLKIGI